MNTTAVSDPLDRAIASQAAELTARVAELKDAASEEASTITRARVLLALSDAADRLDRILDRLEPWRGDAEPDGDDDDE